MCFCQHIKVCLLKGGVMHVQEEFFLICENVCVFISCHQHMLYYLVANQSCHLCPAYCNLMKYTLSVRPFRMQTHFHYATTKT